MPDEVLLLRFREIKIVNHRPTEYRDVEILHEQVIQALEGLLQKAGEVLRRNQISEVQEIEIPVQKEGVVQP